MSASRSKALTGRDEDTRPGLDLALDPDRMREMIQSAWRADGEDVRVLSLSVGDVRYRPGGPCWILYQAKLRDGEGRGHRLWLSARILARGEHPDPLPEELVTRYRTRPGTVIRSAELMLSGPSIVLYPFPVDAALPGLFDASDAAAMKRHLGHLWSPRKVRVRAVTVEHRGYTPQARAAFSYEVLAEDRRTGVPEVRRLIGKMHARKETARVFADQWALWSAGRGWVPLAPPVGFLGRVGLTLQEQVGGERLGGMVDRPGFGRHVRHTARVLATLHQLRFPLSSRRKPSDEADTVRRWAGVLAAIRADLGPRISGIEHRLIDAIQTRSRPSAPIHADFHHTNVLVDGSAIHLIDFDEMAWGDPMVDVGRFLGSLRVPARRAFGSIDGLQTEREIFLGEYLRRAGGDERQARLFEAAALLIAAGSSFRIQRENWEEETALLVEECERILTLAEAGSPVAAGPSSPEERGIVLKPKEKRAWIQDGVYMLATLEPLIRESSGAHIMECRPLKPSGPRSHQRYRLRGWIGEDAWESTVIGIPGRDRGGKTLVERMGTLAAALGTSPDHFRFPRPVGYVRALSLLVWDPPAGQGLLTLEEEAAAAAATRVARGLAALGRVPMSVDKVWSWKTERTRMERRLREGALESETEIRRARELLVAVSARIPEPAGEPARELSLRGLNPRHVLVSDDGVGLDRVEDLVMAPAGFAAAEFLARLILLGIGPGAWPLARSTQAAFRKAYGSSGAGYDLDACIAGLLLRLGIHKASRGTDPGEFPDIMDAAAACLEAGAEAAIGGSARSGTDRPGRDLNRALAGRVRGEVRVLTGPRHDPTALLAAIRAAGIEPAHETGITLREIPADTILIRGLLENLDASSTRTVLDAAWSRVPPGGRLIVAVPNGKLTAEAGQVRRFTRRSLRRELRHLGKPKLVTEQPLRWLVMTVSREREKGPRVSRTDRCRLRATARQCRGRVVELGCGRGHLAGMLAARGLEVVALDKNREKVEAARALYPGVSFMIADILDAKLEEEDFDTVVLAEVLEHLPPDIGERILERSMGLVRPGGRLVVSVPNEDCVPHRNHLRQFDIRSLEELLQRYGRTRLLSEQPYKWLLMVVEK